MLILNALTKEWAIHRWKVGSVTQLTEIKVLVVFISGHCLKLDKYSQFSNGLKISTTHRSDEMGQPNRTNYKGQKKTNKGFSGYLYPFPCICHQVCWVGYALGIYYSPCIMHRGGGNGQFSGTYVFFCAEQAEFHIGRLQHQSKTLCIICLRWFG